MPNREIVDINENLILMRITGSDFNNGNITCIVLEDGLVFVDTGQFPKYVKEFRQEMEERFEKKTSFVLLTHTHWDHILGMDVFRDIPIIASHAGISIVKENIENDLSQEGRKKIIQDTKKWLEDQGAPITEERKEWWNMLRDVQVFPPTIGVNGELCFESNGKVYKYNPIGGHSECSAYVHCETDRVLITGDNLVAEHASNSPCMLANFNREGIGILERFENMEIDTYIPGHGPPVQKEYLKKSRDWFNLMFNSLESLKSHDVEKEDAIKDSSLPEFFEDQKPRMWERILEVWYDSV